MVRRLPLTQGQCSHIHYYEDRTLSMLAYTMDLNSALDAVKAGITQQDLADRLGVNVQRIRQARLHPSAAGYRPPPDGWREALQGLAQERGLALLDISAALADSLDPPA